MSTSSSSLSNCTQLTYWGALNQMPSSCEGYSPPKKKKEDREDGIILLKDMKAVSILMTFPHPPMQTNDDDKGSHSQLFENLFEEKNAIKSECSIQLKELPKARTHLEGLKLKCKDKKIEGVIVYPSAGDQKVKTIAEECIIFVPPGGYWAYGLDFSYKTLDPSSPPAMLMQARKCPVILFDYSRRYITIKFKNGFPEMESPRAGEYERECEDLKIVIDCFYKRTKKITLLGSSYGAAIALLTAASLSSRQLSKIEQVICCDTPHLKSSGLSSLTSMPKGGIVEKALSDVTGSGFSKKRPKITLLSHCKDPILGKNKLRLREVENVSVYYSPHIGHGNISNDMMPFIDHESHHFPLTGNDESYFQDVMSDVAIRIGGLEFTDLKPDFPQE